MRTTSATEASRKFSDLLDAIERGETVTVTRGHRPIAETRPARRSTGRDLRSALDDTTVPDEQFVIDITDATRLLSDESADPRADTRSWTPMF